MTTKDKSALPGGTALNLERRLSFRFSILATKVIRCVAEMYGPKYGLLPSGWKAMAAIGRFGPVSAKEVCAHTTVEPDKVTRAVDRHSNKRLSKHAPVFKNPENSVLLGNDVTFFQNPVTFLFF